MRKSKKFLSLPVVSLDEGKEIGRVRGLVINPQNAEVAALIVQVGGFFTEQKVVPYPNVVSAGSNALTIQKANNAEKLTSLPQIVNLVKESVQLRGSRVITEGGTALGYVDEFYVDPATGKIAAYEISANLADGFIKGKAVLPAQEVRTIGKDVLVVHNGAEETLTRGEGKLSESLKNIKESTNRVIQKAWQPRVKTGEKIDDSSEPETAHPDTPETKPSPPGSI